MGHVRYGAAMALGIACAGTGSKKALALIEPMCNDSVNYVRQGALIASALILIQHTETTCPEVKHFRSMYSRYIDDKRENEMAKFGAILAQGIIDAGGRNVTVSLQSRTGHTHMMAVVGMLVFTQYWYWFPLSHFLSLAFTPSAVIGLNENLDMPVLKIKSNAKPSTYAYPAPLEEKKKEAKEKKAGVSAAEKGAERMEVEGEKGETEKKDIGTEKGGKDEKEKKEKEEKDKAEATFDMLNNPARVMKPQLQVISLEGKKYRPVKEITVGGIIMMKKIKSQEGGNEEEDEIVTPVEIKRELGEVEEEPEPPEPFEYTE